MARKYKAIDPMVMNLPCKHEISKKASPIPAEVIDDRSDNNYQENPPDGVCHYTAHDRAKVHRCSPLVVYILAYTASTPHLKL